MLFYFIASVPWILASTLSIQFRRKSDWKRNKTRKQNYWKRIWEVNGKMANEILKWDFSTTILPLQWHRLPFSDNIYNAQHTLNTISHLFRLFSSLFVSLRLVRSLSFTCKSFKFILQFCLHAYCFDYRCSLTYSTFLMHHLTSSGKMNENSKTKPF